MFKYYLGLFKSIPSAFRGTVEAWLFWGGGVTLPALTLLNHVLGNPVGIPDVPPGYALALLAMAFLYAIARVNYERFVALERDVAQLRCGHEHPAMDDPEKPIVVVPNDEKVGILKLVYTEEAEALRFEVTTAQRLMTYFVTLELALGAWLTANPIRGASWKVLVFGLNLALGVMLGRLVVLNYRRRHEVVEAMRGALQGLGLRSKNQYLPGRSIHEFKVNASWKPGYLMLIGFFCLAQALPLFFLSRCP